MRKLLAKIRKILKDRRTRRWLTRFVSGFAAVVVFVTTYALVLPAITMEAEALCGIPAHQHNDSCYEERLICGIPESEGHHHSDSCYSVRSVQTCTMKEHTHGTSCYDAEGNLTCSEREHQHGQGCYKEQRDLICTIPESDGHRHTASCYEKVLVCGMEVHTHSPECYQQEIQTDFAAVEATVTAAVSAEAYPDDYQEEFDVAEEADGAWDENAGDGSGADSLTESDYENGADNLVPADEAHENGDGAASGDSALPGAGENTMPEPGDGSDAAPVEGTESGSVNSPEAAAGDGADTEAGDRINAASGDKTGSESGTAAGPDAAAPADQASGTDGAGTGNLQPGTDTDGCVPVLKALDFRTILNHDTDIYYHHISEGEVVEDSSAITSWTKTDDQTTLAPADLVRVYLAYTIPAGSLNETNAVARYRLPGNLHLTDAQIETINRFENGISGQYVDYDSLQITDVEKHTAYLGVEAVEGTRTPDQDVSKYLQKLSKSRSGDPQDAQEYISATVKSENVYDQEGLYGEKGAYLGTDLIFTFSPYTVQKNRHEYDASGKPTKAGETVRGWLTLDFNMSQIDWNDNTARVVFVAEDRDTGIGEISRTLMLENPEEGLNEENPEESDPAEENPSEDNAAEENAEANAAEENAAEEDPSDKDQEKEDSADGKTAEDADQAENKEDADNAAAEVTEETHPAVNFEDTIKIRSGSLSTDTAAVESLPGTSRLTVSVSADPCTFPAGTTMVLSAVEDMDAVASALEEAVDARTKGFQAVDISFRNAEGKEIEPLKPIRVTMKSKDIQSAAEDSSVAPLVVHVEDRKDEEKNKKSDENGTDSSGGNAAGSTAGNATDNAAGSTAGDTTGKISGNHASGTKTPAATIINTIGTDESTAAPGRASSDAAWASDNAQNTSDTLTFESDAFSVYAIVYTVDFEYSVNGKMYQFSLPGGGFVSFTDLVEVLGIIGDTNSGKNGDENEAEIDTAQAQDANGMLDVTASDEAKKFVADVASVEFSNPDLLDVSKVETDTTVGQIKESRNLECEYSAELTEEQIEEINAQTVESGDWALISLQPFKSDESLTVTMKNGDQFVVNVTDAQLKKTVISASGETIEVVVTYDDSAEIPVGATLEITEFAEDSDEYQAAREAVVEKKQAEDPAFDDEEFGVTAFDVSIVDEDGNQVEPKATVDVSMKMKSLPEEAAEENVQYSFEIHHLDESSGEVAVENVASAIDGSIQIEEETAQAEFQLDSFSTFTVSWNRRGTGNNTTDLRWRYRQNYWEQYTARAFLTANYVDESGNAISRPNGIGYTIDNDNFYDGAEYTVDIGNVLGISVDNYTYKRAYITDSDGKKLTVTSVKAERHGNTSTVSYYNEAEVVKSASYTGTDRHDFGDDGLDVTIEYEKNNNFTTVHYGYMDGDRFVEFDQQPGPTDTSTSFGWAHLIYDFAGTDDQGLHVDWKYSGTYYHTSETTNPEQGGTAMQPILRYYNNAWRYYNGNISSQNDTRNNSNWKAVADGSDIYVVYEKPVIPMGGTPSPSENSPQPDTPYILKESVSNTDGTNTLSLSVTGSRKPMITEKVADVIVILDLSSSMRRDIGSQTAYDSNYQTVTNSRYYQAKNAVQKLADRLYAVNGTDGEQYRMGLITFSNYAGRTYLSPTENQSTFQSTLDGITAYEGSGTNWEHALQLANQMAVASDRATYIVFITDGEPSVRQTRGNLTNEQLSGNNVAGQVGNPSYNPSNEGDIFHGGLAGGNFFNRNGDYTTPDFRDYFGSATFGGLMNNDVWDARNRNAAVDEVASMLGHNKGFYAIGVSSEVNYLGDFAAAAGVDANHYKLVTSAKAFDEVIDDILEELDINGVSGQANIKMFDGITDLTQTISKVNQTEDNRLLGVDGDFKYYKSTAPADWSTWTTAQKAAYALGVEYANSSETPTEYASYTSEEIDAYNLGKDISFTEWTTRAEDGCAAAVYNTETGAVEWNMGQKFMLEDGVTYKVSFICWPSQEAYDIIAKLNNGTITFGDTDLYPQEIWDQFEGDLTNGYTLKTNAEGANTKYSKATDVNGNVTVGDEQDPLPFQNVPPMPLDKDKLNVAKTWQASRIDSQTPESVILQVVGDDELYKQFEITPTETVDGSDTPNKGRSENIYISCGHLKVNKDTGEVVIYESGHDFTLREIGENSRHWDLDASICRPMKINMEETMLVLVEEDDVPNAMKTNVNLAYLAESGNEYYRVDGNVYKVDEALTDITGFNTRRSFLDLSKEVLVDNEVWPETVDEVFTYKIKFNIDPTTLSWDPDLEKYIIISTRDANGTVLPSSILALTDAEYTPTAKLPSECGFEESNNTRYLVAENDVEFYLSIKNGWSVRFLNLPAGTTYSIEEVLPEDSNYDFNTVRLETRKDSSSATPVSTDTYTTIKMDGSIEETSTLYKVVYRNAAITQEVQILKTGQDASTPLGGAKFDLYTEKAYTSNPQEAPFKTDLVSSNEAAAKGKIDLGEIPIGKYYLVETKAPDGYNMRTEPVIITVSKTSVTYDDGTTLSQSGSGISQIGAVYQLKVTNDEGVALPSTGGPGTRLFTILGSILILGAGILLWRRRRTI